MPSIEILVEKPCQLPNISEENYRFAVKTSSPPFSHRNPALWQQQFTNLSGMLVHVGEPRFKEQEDGWFFAYDIINTENCETFRFKAEYVDDVVQLLESLLACSEDHRIHFTTDWQLAPKPKVTTEREMTMQQFLRKHDKEGIHFNTWITIVAGA